MPVYVWCKYHARVKIILHMVTNSSVFFDLPTNITYILTIYSCVPPLGWGGAITVIYKFWGHCIKYPVEEQWNCSGLGWGKSQEPSLSSEELSLNSEEPLSLEELSLSSEELSFCSEEIILKELLLILQQSSLIPHTDSSFLYTNADNSKEERKSICKAFSEFSFHDGSHAVRFVVVFDRTNWPIIR